LYNDINIGTHIPIAKRSDLLTSCPYIMSTSTGNDPNKPGGYKRFWKNKKYYNQQQMLKEDNTTASNNVKLPLFFSKNDKSHLKQECPIQFGYKDEANTGAKHSSDISRNEDVDTMVSQLHSYLQKNNNTYIFQDKGFAMKFSGGTMVTPPGSVTAAPTATTAPVTAAPTAPATTASSSSSNIKLNIFAPEFTPLCTSDVTPVQSQPTLVAFTFKNPFAMPNQTYLPPNPFTAPAPPPAPAPAPTLSTQHPLNQEKKYIEINEEIKSIDDLISMCDKYPMTPNIEYNINMKAIHDIREPLEDLQKMVGMSSLKCNIIDQILYFVQNLHVAPEERSKLKEAQAQAQAQATKNIQQQQQPLFTFTDKPLSGANTDSNVAAAAPAPPGVSNQNQLFTFPTLTTFHMKSSEPTKETDILSNIFSNALYNIQKEQDLLKKGKKGASSGDFMHTVIYGPPGTGKTEVARIMGRIFSQLGILKKKTFKKVTRHDLIAGYLGQTAMKTRDVIKESLGGVLFIDEAYSLGNPEKRDSFAKECIDTLCEALSDHKDNWMVIIAGYEKELNDCFFNYNEGLNSRFTWRFKLDSYKSDEMKMIFLKKVAENGWKIKENENIPDEWFQKNNDYFTFYGRDMETLFAKTKIAHSRRVFCLPEKDKTQITMKDLEKGFELYLQNDEVKERKEKNTIKYQGSIYL